MSRATALLLPALLVACGDERENIADVEVTPVETSLGDTNDAAPEPEVDDATPTGCPPGSDGCSAIDWLQADDHPRATDHHTTHLQTSAAGTFLYVIGGATMSDDLAVFDEVRRAPIEGGGLVGAWQDEPALPLPLAFHGQAVHGDRVYLAGGLSTDADGPFATNVALVGSVDDDGHLTFARTTALPAEARVHPTAHALHDRLVVVGGTAQAPIDTTRVADIAADGELGAWRAGPTLPTPRSHHAGVVRGDRIWIFGGFDEENAPLPTILRSTHDATGEPTGWEVVGTMDDPPWTHAATLYRDGVLLVGGGQGGPGAEVYVDRMRWARLTDDGLAGPFVDAVNPLPRARSHVHQAPIHAGFIYSVGGRNGRTYTSIRDVYVGYLAF
ncbi:MAG: hypothetical protein IT385_00140 [Deltaproteobacteria bacterium]|nr:hypothetical protein [Deltaproteobacteria bacterium]